MNLVQKALVSCIVNKYTTHEKTFQYFSPSTESKAERLYGVATSIVNVL